MIAELHVDMTRLPKIAILMDENTSTGGKKYEGNKNYFAAIDANGGMPLGVPYFSRTVSEVAAQFDGLLTCGGRFSYPAEWYSDGQASSAPSSDRFQTEAELVVVFLALKKPVLGMCAGMQMLAGLHGSKLAHSVSDVAASPLEHDGPEVAHDITIADQSLLQTLVGLSKLSVNSYHREAISNLGESTVATAHSEDGVIEAIELEGYTFALGLQWHQELHFGSSHEGNRIFQGFVEAC